MCWQGGAFFTASHRGWDLGSSTKHYTVLVSEELSHCSAFHSRLCIARWVKFTLFNITHGLITLSLMVLIMTTSVFRNLRESLDISAENFAAQNNIDVGKLVSIEEGTSAPTETLLRVYAHILHVDISLLRLLALHNHKHPLFIRQTRAFFINALTAYLKLANWMAKLDEPNKKL